MQMNQVNRIVSKLNPPTKNRSKLLVFLIFVVFSSVLWLLIKLSHDYSVSISLTVTYTELPGGKWMQEQTDNQLKISLNSRGFVLMRALYLRNVKTLEIPLNKLPYRKRSQTEYYINTANLRDIVAKAFNINETDIDFDDTDLRFQLEDLHHIMAAVKPQLTIAYRPQYQAKDIISVIPDSVNIYGPKNLLDTIQSIMTRPISLKDVDMDIRLSAPLQFDPGLLSVVPEEVAISITVDRFTEATFTVPIQLPQQPRIKTFPDAAQISFQLSLSDFSRASASQFIVELDTTGMHTGQSSLKLNLVSKPDYVRNISLSPSTVEFIRIKE